MSQNSNCSKCDYKYFCGGFCHFNSLFQTNDYVYKPYCESTKCMIRLILKYIVDCYHKDKHFFSNVAKVLKIDHLFNINQYYENNKFQTLNNRVRVMDDLKIIKNSNVQCIDLDDSGILFLKNDLKSKYIANITTMAIWDIIDNRKTAKQILDAVCKYSEKSIEEIKDDIYHQIAIFKDLGFIEFIK